MELLLTPSNITFFIGLAGTIFAVFMFFRKPQEDLETKQAVFDERDKSKATVLAQKEMENKAIVLAQQVQWEKEANEKKFTEFGLRLDTALNLAQNHIHSIDVKVDNLAVLVGVMDKSLTKLFTIVDERMPKKQL